MKLPKAVLFFAATIALANANPNIELGDEPVYRAALIPRSHKFSLFPNHNLQLLGRQAANCSITSSSCGSGCCGLTDECCSDGTGCCPLLNDCCQDGCCPKGYSCDPQGNSDEPCACYGSFCSDSDGDSSASASAGPSPTGASSGSQPNAATTLSPGLLSWTGVLGMVIAGGIGAVAVVL